MSSFNRLRKGYARTRGCWPAFFLCVALAFLISERRSLHAQSIPAEITVSARVNTGAVSGDADDPAIWIHPTDPALSLVIGTDKVGDFVYVWDMNGQERQRIAISNRPNNGDVRHGMPVGGVPVDIYIVGAEDPSRLVIFKIDPSARMLSDITAAGGTATPQVKEPYGVCLYRRAGDGAMFAFVNSNGGVDGVLHQYQLADNGAGRVKATFVRSFGGDVNGNHSEGMVADDQLGYVYIAEEDCCVHKFYADPAMGNARLAVFAQNDGIDPDREGLGIYGCANGTGYILLSSQGNKRVKVYRREGDPGNPHSHSLVTTIYTPNVGGTDGLDATNRPAGPNFPFGFLAKHNAPSKSFALIAWEDIAQTYLTICPEGPVSCDVTANFSANTSSGCAALTVNFTDQSTGTPTSWAWDFGDGNTSTQQNTTHVYAAPGAYTVTLTASSESCSDDETKTNYITVSGAPIAAFAGSPMSGNAPVIVNFTDQSTGNPTSWAWDFGDGGSSTQQNPSHTYNTAGDYTVILTAGNTCGSTAETKVAYIHVDPCIPPTANFAASSTSGNASFTVNFTDQSTGNPASWAWDFGDGGSSTQQNPSHTFTAAGDYTVQLTATNVCGFDAEIKTAYIHVDPCLPPMANFVAASTSGNVPFTVNFTDQSTGSPTSWSWDFGDGGTSTQQNPAHTYNTAGTYSVTLTATSSCGSDGETKANYITVNNTPTGNLALNKLATASSTNSSYAPSRAVDGSTASSSYWRSANVSKTTPNTWLRVDLGSAFSLTRAVVKWKENYFGKRYRFQISNSGGNADGEWTTVHTNTFGAAGTQDVTFTSPFAARYFRIRIDQNNKDNTRILELECYASAAKLNAGEDGFGSAASPDDFELEQNYPNPFWSGAASRLAGSPTTMIRFRVPVESEATLTIYSATGQLVKDLANGTFAGGKHSFAWDATDKSGQRVASGVYLYVLKAGDFTAQRKLVLMK
jgi:PKD repeat protein